MQQLPKAGHCKTYESCKNTAIWLCQLYCTEKQCPSLESGQPGLSHINTGHTKFHCTYIPHNVPCFKIHCLSNGRTIKCHNTHIVHHIRRTCSYLLTNGGMCQEIDKRSGGYDHPELWKEIEKARKAATTLNAQNASSLIGWAMSRAR